MMIISLQFDLQLLECVLYVPYGFVQNATAQKFNRAGEQREVERKCRCFFNNLPKANFFRTQTQS